MALEVGRQSEVTGSIQLGKKGVLPVGGERTLPGDFFFGRKNVPKSGAWRLCGRGPGAVKRLDFLNERRGHRLGFLIGLEKLVEMLSVRRSGNRGDEIRERLEERHAEFGPACGSGSGVNRLQGVEADDGPVTGIVLAYGGNALRIEDAAAERAQGKDRFAAALEQVEEFIARLALTGAEVEDVRGEQAGLHGADGVGRKALEDLQHEVTHLAFAFQRPADIPHLALREEVVHDGTAVMFRAAELRDVDAADVQAAQGVLDIEFQQRGVVAANLEDDFRDARTVFVEGVSHDHERAAAGVFLAGVKGDAAVHRGAHNADLCVDIVNRRAAAQAHAAEGERSERKHGKRRIPIRN